MDMSGDPVKGFDERITKRARTVSTALLTYPIVAVAFEYFQFLLQEGSSILDALGKARTDTLLLVAPLAGLPVVVFAFFREIPIHYYLDRLLGTRRKVGEKIVDLMSKLAGRVGYEDPSRITAQPHKAIDWFYFYINAAVVTRERAFEIWEGYYVGLYISTASALSIVMCIYLAIISARWWMALAALIPLTVFLLTWAHRHFHVIPKIMSIPIQQVADLIESPEVLAEAKRRFG